MRAAGERLGFSVRHVGRYDYALTGHVTFDGPPDGRCACGCGAPTLTATRTRGGNLKGQPSRYAPGHSSRRGAVATLLRRNGVPRALAKHKVIPDSVFRLPADQLARFLGVFWMCDGTVSKTGVEITLASERMVRQLQHLLLRFGVQSRVRFHATAIGDRPFDAWNLRVYSQCDQTFLDTIPLWGAKRAKLAALCAARTRPVQANCGAPSASAELRAELAALHPRPGRPGRHRAVPQDRAAARRLLPVPVQPPVQPEHRPRQPAGLPGLLRGVRDRRPVRLAARLRHLLGPGRLHRGRRRAARLRPHRRADRLLRRQ